MNAQFHRFLFYFLLFEHGFHHSVKMEVNQLLIGRQKLVTGTRVDELEPRYLPDVIIVQDVLVFSHLLSHQLLTF